MLVFFRHTYLLCVTPYIDIDAVCFMFYRCTYHYLRYFGFYCIYFCAYATTNGGGFCFPVIRLAVRQSAILLLSVYIVRCVSSQISRNAFVHLAYGFQRNVPQIFIVSVETDQKVCHDRGQRSRSLPDRML